MLPSPYIENKMKYSINILFYICFMWIINNILFDRNFIKRIQDTLKSYPPENKMMKRASLVGVSTTTLFYMLCGCLGYAAFGNDAPGNFLTGFGFFEPYWLIDFANVCIAIHLVGAYQVRLIISFFIKRTSKLL